MALSGFIKLNTIRFVNILSDLLFQLCKVVLQITVHFTSPSTHSKYPLFTLVSFIRIAGVS